MNEKVKLIMDLKKLEEVDFKVNSIEEVTSYLPLLLKYIGDTDPELRDGLIYPALYKWIIVYNYFDHKVLKSIMHIIVDEEHLFYDIGNDEGDSVFTRTFSSLIVVFILYKHQEEALLSKEEFLWLKDKVISYYSSERDLRGYIPMKGWAHGAAHGADVLDELVKCKECNQTIIQEILESITNVLFNEQYMLYEEEDERISVVIYQMLKRDLLTEEQLIHWLKEMSSKLQQPRLREQQISRSNTKNLIRSLYYKVAYSKLSSIDCEVLREAELLFNRSILLSKELFD